MKKASFPLSIVAVALSVIAILILMFIFAFWDVIFKNVIGGYDILVKTVMTVPWNYIYSLVFSFIMAMVVLFTSKSNSSSAIIEILLIVFAVILYGVFFRSLTFFQRAFVNDMGDIASATLVVNTRILSIVFYLSDIVRLLIIFICGIRIYEKWFKKRNNIYKLTGVYSMNGGSINKFRVALSIIVLILSCCSLVISFCNYFLWEIFALFLNTPQECVEYGFILPLGISIELLCGFVLSVMLLFTTLNNNRSIALEIVITTLFMVIITIISKCIDYVQIRNYDSDIAILTYSFSEALFEFPKKIYTFYVPIAIMLCGMNVAKKRLDKQDIKL